MPFEADIILFGIQAALRINAQFRHAFAESTLSRAITLPLPGFPAQANRSTWENFYRDGDGKEFVVSNLRVRGLLNRLSDTGDLADAETAELGRLYQEHRTLVDASTKVFLAQGENPAGLSNEDLVHLVTIRQWREGEDPNPTLLRRMAGTLISIAVDYAAEMPGVLSSNTARGKALHSLLQAFQEIDFATDGRTRVLEGMFTATLEMVRDHPEIISEDERARKLVHAVAKGLYTDTQAFLDSPGTTQTGRDLAAVWSKLVFRSVVQSVGTTVFSEPQRYLGLKREAEAELVAGAGRAVLASLLSDSKVDLGALLTQQSLDRIVQAALLAVGNHPELVGADGGFLKQLVAITASELAHSAGNIGLDFLPEALGLVLEHTAENLELLLPDGVAHPENHLLVVAAREVLRQLSAKPAGGASWTPRFGSGEVLQVLGTVIDEVIQNPGWLEKRGGDDAVLLGEAMHDVLATLREKAPPRLRKQTGLAILEAALRAAGRRLEFNIDGPANRRLIALAIEGVFTAVLPPGVDAKAAWLLTRDTVLARLVQLVLEKLEKFGVSEDKLQKAKTVLANARQGVAQGGGWSWEMLEEQLEQALA